MPVQRNKSFFSRVLIAVLAGASIFSLVSCQVPPTPPPVENGSTIPISHAFFTWKKDREFRRISEYFTDEENTGSNCIVRTDPAVREGLYFILTLEVFQKIPAGSRATLRYFNSFKKGEQKQVFELPAFTATPAGEIRLGLTGTAWPEEYRRNRPVAWQISITAPDGTLLVSRSSFLWASENTETPVVDEDRLSEKK